MLAKDNRTHVLEERGAPYDMDLKGPVVTIIADGNAVVEFPGASGEALLRALVAPGYLQEASWDGDKGHRTYILTPKGRDHAES
jgi:hypothetical protein